MGGGTLLPGKGHVGGSVSRWTLESNWSGGWTLVLLTWVDLELALEAEHTPL